MLAVWSGNTLTNLQLIAENDEYSGCQSAVFISAQSGMTYQIAAYGWYDERGSITLNITNDVAGKISGTVTGPDGVTPLQDIGVGAYRWNQEFEYWQGWISSDNTDADGNYSIGGLAAGTYRVEFRDSNGDYVSEFYDDAADVNSGADIVVPAETIVTNINASLEPPRIDALRKLGGSDWELQYVSAMEKEYLLQQAASPTSSWQDVGESFLSQPGTNTISLQSSATNRVWRIREYP